MYELGRCCLPWWFHTFHTALSFHLRWRHTSGTPTPASVLVYQPTWCWWPEETPWSRSCRCCPSRTFETRVNRTSRRCLEERSWNRQTHSIIIIIIIIIIIMSSFMSEKEAGIDLQELSSRQLTVRTVFLYTVYIRRVWFLKICNQILTHTLFLCTIIL